MNINYKTCGQVVLCRLNLFTQRGLLKNKKSQKVAKQRFNSYLNTAKMIRKMIDPLKPVIIFVISSDLTLFLFTPYKH